ncbi:MAG: hypothetical protein ACTSW1_14930 [Candidatus Hodarchaeales archaeon]
MERTDLTIRMALLSHPDDFVTDLIKRMVRAFPERATFTHFPSISANIATIILEELGEFHDRKIKLLLIQPVSNLFTDKLIKRYYETYGALIFFREVRKYYDEFVAAKVFYENYRKLTDYQRHPVAFVEMLEDNDFLLMDNSLEPEILEDAPYNFYYGIKPENVTAFKNILQFITRQFLTAEEIIKIILSEKY